MDKTGIFPTDAALRDEEIVKLFFDRDEDALRQTEKQYGKLIYRICRSVLNDRLDSEECVNTVYVRLWGSIPPEEPSSLKAYVIRVSRFVALDKYRTEHRKKRITSDMTESLDDLSLFLNDGYSGEKEIVYKETAKQINDFIRSKPKREQSVFVKRYFYSLPVAKIAEEDGLSGSQVKRMLSKAKKELKAILTKGE